MQPLAGPSASSYPYPTTSKYAYAYGPPGSGSYTNPIILDSPPFPSASLPDKPPPAKRQKKKKDPDAPEPEKRGAIFKKKCPQNILERVARVQEQRMFLLDRTRNGNELREEFAMQGSTGNVYTVIIDKKPSCNCPDALKGNHCKHILFIFLKVLQVTQASGYWYQKALLTSELEEIFANAPLAPAALANARVRDAYAKATGKSGSQNIAAEGKKRIPEKDDDCPVCYETLFEVKESKMTFCDTCGNGLHKECFQQWVKAARGSATCVFCRASIASSTPAGSSGTRATPVGGAGYLNLAAEAGISPQRDTSSYYHGPRRGQRHYGYQNYDDDFLF
ncbi:hypothetical protein BXZ70DRAFT_894818 [Cristinia sonorae]|uniref:Uncharacterized protein n=1 Tax=Cristinia sonorae TaxID=1940300 RepID=A0A8K0XPH7_9AGAR|nr:hypothetical protein BXZ70DRAFT_894818 [Cristinia sonorae]